MKTLEMRMILLYAVVAVCFAVEAVGAIAFLRTVLG
jgi:hypothetical protein